jgi:hypothetical protein
MKSRQKCPNKLYNAREGRKHGIGEEGVFIVGGALVGLSSDLGR